MRISDWSSDVCSSDLRWFGGKLTANLAAYYIDWRNIQVQANRQSDSIQFATNIGRAVSKGLEAEITVTPIDRLVLGPNGSMNESQVPNLTRAEEPTSEIQSLTRTSITVSCYPQRQN